ncbi:MAG TPA: hypothetical protein PK956_10545, partial [Burkholderiaceae bacterium]|nr:hypothetical protein [Burkholderiaceae bacterium]
EAGGQQAGEEGVAELHLAPHGRRTATVPDDGMVPSECDSGVTGIPGQRAGRPGQPPAFIH